MTMTDETHAVLKKMKLGGLIRDPKARDRILDEFNRDNTPDVKPLGGVKGMAVVKELNHAIPETVSIHGQ
jgi:hypothetical protein